MGFNTLPRVHVVVRLFGDASGDLKSLLSGDEEIYVAGVVAGRVHDCRRCAKRAVEQVDDIPEAKWNDMSRKQKRRLFADLSDSNLDLGIARVDMRGLIQIDDHYKIYNSRFELDWDLALEARAYAEIVSRLSCEQRAHFVFDRVNSPSQSDRIVSRTEALLNDVTVSFEGSRQEKGIQTADCLAGAAAEDERHDTDWLNKLSDDRLVECGETVLSDFDISVHTYNTDP